MWALIMWTLTLKQFYMESGTLSIFNPHKWYLKNTNPFKYIFYEDDRALSTCVPDENAMDSAGLIYNELK